MLEAGLAMCSWTWCGGWSRCAREHWFALVSPRLTALVSPGLASLNRLQLELVLFQNDDEAKHLLLWPKSLTLKNDASRVDRALCPISLLRRFKEFLLFLSMPCLSFKPWNVAFYAIKES